MNAVKREGEEEKQRVQEKHKKHVTEERENSLLERKNVNEGEENEDNN